MPNWNQLLDEMNTNGGPTDMLRRKYLKLLNEKTGRNVITYYSGWLQKPGVNGLGINDEDKNGFMSTINKLDRSKGLDLILHTPGGETAATESLVAYLRKMFGIDIRVIVPQLAMSGGTMIACASKVILMGKESSLGPVDPQISGIPAHGIIEEFEQARIEIGANPGVAIPLWQPIIAKYSPALIGECLKVINWSDQLVREWLSSGMFNGEAGAQEKIDKIAMELGSHALTLSHSRHLSADKCKEIGLKVEMLETNQEVQDAVLSVHHACMLTFSQTTACKLIENHLGSAFIKMMGPVLVESNKF